MDDTLTILIAIVLAAVLMFVFPLMTMSDRTDDISQLTVETAVTEFVDDVRSTGKLTIARYDQLVQTLASTGNSHEIEMERRALDENPNKKTAKTPTKKIGENVYCSEYTSQILDQLEEDGTIYLKEGDIFLASAKANNITLSQQFKNFIYSVTGNDNYIIGAEHAGIVTTNGN